MITLKASADIELYQMIFTIIDDPLPCRAKIILINLSLFLIAYQYKKLCKTEQNVFIKNNPGFCFQNEAGIAVCIIFSLLYSTTKPHFFIAFVSVLSAILEAVCAPFTASSLR